MSKFYSVYITSVTVEGEKVKDVMKTSETDSLFIVFEIFAVKCGIFGAQWGIPKWEMTCPGPMYTIIQNFTLIGINIVEISVTKHIHTKT